jgi:hypothetical protein
MRLKHILNPKPIVESHIKVGTMFMVHGYPLLKGLFPNQYYKIISINGDEATLEKVNFQGKETNLTTTPVTHKLSSIEASLKGGDNSDMNGLEIVNEATSSEIIKDLDKVKNDLLKKVDVLVAKKKKLYSNVDIESPMSADEKKLDKDIADIFSQINQLVLQKRSLKTKSVNEKWSKEYKDSIDCNNPKGFSQKAHCAGKNKNESTIKLKSILKEKLDNNEYQMVDGIIDILNRVKDMSNRKEIADNMVQQFKDENIVFDYNKFYKAIGCN